MRYLFVIFVLYCVPSFAQDAPPNMTCIQSALTTHGSVVDALKLAGAGPRDVFYDLGSGDGGVVLTALNDFHVQKSIGIEINHVTIEAAKKAAVGTKAVFIEGDILKADFHDATVLFMNLGCPDVMHETMKRICVVAPKSRVIMRSRGRWPPAHLKNNDGDWSIYECD